MAIFEDRVFEDSSDEWATPKSFVRPLADAVGGFDLDPASGAEDDPHADETFTEEDDGLTQQWHGNVYLNPPFSNKVEWIEKAMGEVNDGNADLVAMVLPVDTSTEWFHRLITQAPLVCFIGPGRQEFDRRSEHPRGSSPSFAVMVVVFADRIPKQLMGTLSVRGTVYYNRSLYRETTQSTFAAGGSE